MEQLSESAPYGLYLGGVTENVASRGNFPLQTAGTGPLGLTYVGDTTPSVWPKWFSGHYLLRRTDTYEGNEGILRMKDGR